MLVNYINFDINPIYRYIIHPWIDKQPEVKLLAIICYGYIK